MDDEKALYARAELVELVQNGEMKPEEAEAEAERLGVGPLRRVADPAQFDPTSKASWTLVMAVAWIVWRTPDAVRKYWDDYRRECSDWEPLPAAGELKAGYSLDRQKPASLTLLGRDEAISTASGPDEDRKLMSVKSAREQLWQALEEERLTATGEPDLSGDRIQIPAHKWPSLELTSTRNGRRDQLTYTTSGKVAYRNVRLRRSELVSCWPELSDARTELPPLKRGRRRYQQEVAEHFLLRVYGTVNPEPSVFTNGAVVKAIKEAMEDEIKAGGPFKGPNPSSDTILRAARRKRSIKGTKGI